jgi:hypothetical protein
MNSHPTDERNCVHPGMTSADSLTGSEKPRSIFYPCAATMSGTLELRSARAHVTRGKEATPTF